MNQDKASSKTKEKKTPSLVVQITENSLKSNLKNNMSIHKTLADHYNIDGKTEAKVSIPEELTEYELDNVEITIKDQFLSRRDQWHFCANLMKNQAVHPLKYLDSTGVRCRIKSISKKDQKVFSGIISERTSFSIFSRSSHTTVLIEMTKEMYNFDDNG